MLFTELQNRLLNENLVASDGLKEMQLLSNRLSKLLGSENSNFQIEYPLFNVYTNNEHAIITSEIPGIELDDIDIQIVHNTITIKADKIEEKLDAHNSQWHRRERSFGHMTRTIELPFEVDASKTQAKLNKGILVIELPRKEEDKPKKISVKVN